MISELVTLLVYCLIIGIVIWVALYIVEMIPLPPPFAQVARVVIMVIGCLLLIILLLQLAGGLHSLKLG